MKIIKIAGRFILLWLLVIVSMSVASAVSGIRQYVNFTPEQMKSAALALPVVALSYAFVMAFIASSSAWRGLKLYCALFLAFFGINGFLAQIETVVYLQHLVDRVPPAALPRIVFVSFLTGLLISFWTVLVYGRMSGRQQDNPDAAWLKIPAGELAWKIILAGIAYVLVYFFFGVAIAKPLAGADFDRYYSGLKLPWWMPLFQTARGCVWAIIAIPVFKLMKGKREKAALAVALMFAVFIGMALITPNPFMTDGMRFGHLIELLTSNFLNGWVVDWILSFKKPPFQP